MNMQIRYAFSCDHRSTAAAIKTIVTIPTWRTNKIETMFASQMRSQFGVNYILLFANHCVAGDSSAYMSALVIVICLMSRSIGNWDGDVFVKKWTFATTICSALARNARPKIDCYVRALWLFCGLFCVLHIIKNAWKKKMGKCVVYLILLLRCYSK